ncbi:MAG: hypothetical protein WBZ36_05120, partial [Candidatus Nitrosopolaris sp.]
EILFCLAKWGQLSRLRIESVLKNHDHHVIWDAFKKLEDNKMIIRTRSTINAGRREFFFRITEDGLRTLILEIRLPQEFWHIMLGYCYHANNDNKVSLEKVKRFYQLFIQKYLKYSERQRFTFELELFDRACNDWLDKINANEKISIGQVILEILALHPNLTLKELVKKIKGYREDEIANTLFTLTSIKHRPATVDDSYVHGTARVIEKWQLLSTKIIKVRHNLRGVDTYQLSLFGVLFLLKLIRQNDINRLRHGLYNNDKSFLEYCDIIADNYRNAIPLIFRKWSLLKRILKSLAAYNFDIVTDQQFRDKIMREMAIFKRPGEEEIHITSGNKYLFEGYRSILEISQKQLGEVQIRGIEALHNTAHRIVYFPDGTLESARKLDEKKIDAVSKLINEITVNLDTVGYDPITYKEKVMEWGIGLDEAERLSQFFDIDSIEGPIVNEISFLYYLNLNDEWYFHIMNDSLERPLYERPLRCLLAILKEDREIREWFSKLIGDIVKYQEGVMQSMREFNDRISHFTGNTGVYGQPAGSRMYKGIQK